MFLSAHEIALSRERALNNMLGLADACLDAAHCLSAAVAAAGRASIEQGARQWASFGAARPDSAAQLPAALWLDHVARAGRLFDEALSIFGATHKAIIRSAEIQVRILDSMAIAAIDRASKSSPWETELALAAVKSSLQSAEHALHEMSEAAIETVARAESEGHQALVVKAATKPAVAKPATVKSATAKPAKGKRLPAGKATA
ncbi:hypothetical protein LZ012_05475 [Dechloromonas sp. XY25]|uniref:Phasin family protein n=1 Tax=Dechloromonas hankyongensis TaxID=2908002 RepID=A0ABS9JZX4_9RHOO|nr:hypothetical protein [Dechloromonas hankyongensis]MCG2576442.1 hypothetical protein [Dechloromonas hankyongensis]